MELSSLCMILSTIFQDGDGSHMISADLSMAASELRSSQDMLKSQASLNSEDVDPEDGTR